MTFAKYDPTGTEKDVFTIEFKWFQFFNNLTGNQKLVINELKSKNNWSKSFLQFYLNQKTIFFSYSFLIVKSL